jgi:hypothetical protein
MSDRQTVTDHQEAEAGLSAALLEMHSARAALDGALQAVVRVLVLLSETESAEQEYWSLCDEYERVLLMIELRPELQSVLQSRQQQRADLAASFATYLEAERRWKAARKQLNAQLDGTDEGEILHTDSCSPVLA